LKTNTFPEAFMFSLSTLSTIGFGAQGGDVFFGSCASAIFVITAEVSGAKEVGVNY
jgi:hypothetical protein